MHLHKNKCLPSLFLYYEFLYEVMRLCQNNSQIKKKILNVIVHIIKTKERLIWGSCLSSRTFLWRSSWPAVPCGSPARARSVRPAGGAVGIFPAVQKRSPAACWACGAIVVGTRTAAVTSLCPQDVFCQLAVPRYVEGSGVRVPYRARLPPPRVSIYDLRKLSFNEEKDFFFNALVASINWTCIDLSSHCFLNNAV